MELKKVDLFIILALKDLKGATVKDLSIKLYIDKSTINKSLMQLEKLKLIKSTEDRPKVYYLNLKNG